MSVGVVKSSSFHGVLCLMLLAGYVEGLKDLSTFSERLLKPVNSFVTNEGPKWLCFLFGMCSIPSYVQSGHREDPLVPLFEWSQLEFEYSSLQDRQRDIDSGFFIPGIPALIDSDVYYAPDKTNHVFVTNPRFQLGSPATLGEVRFDTYRGNYLIRPYPSWDWHRDPRQCLPNRIISVYRIQIDRCGRLWVLDTGRFGNDMICPPQILAFELKTNVVLYQYELPADQFESRSIFVTPIVDVRDSCQNTFVYAADCQTYSLVVYDVANERSWRITDKTMYPYPSFGTYSILGDSFDLMDGVLGMSLTPYVPGRDRKLFFHAMSSDTENWVYTSEIRNETRFSANAESSPEIFHTYRGRRSSQSAAEAIDRNGIMYFGDMSDVTLNCWDTNSEYGPQNIRVIDNNRTTMQFASGVKVIDNKNGGQELFVVTSRFQKIGAGTQNPNEINFRILAGKIGQRLVDKCKPFAPPPGIFNPDGFVGGGYGLRPKPHTGLFKVSGEDMSSEVS